MYQDCCCAVLILRGYTWTTAAVVVHGLHHQHLISLFNLTPVRSTALQAYNFFIVNMYKDWNLWATYDSRYYDIRQWVVRSGSHQAVVRHLSASHQLSGTRQFLGSRQAVVRQSSGSRQAIVRQSSDSRQAAIRQSSSSHQAVIRQLSGSLYALFMQSVS